MSHITEGKLKLRDLDAIEEAGAQLGFELIRDKKTYNWYQQFVNDSETGRQFARERGVSEMGKCEHVLRLKNASAGDYEVGLVKSLDGDGWNIVYDEYGSGRKLSAALQGREAPALKREYAAAVATKRAQKKLGKEGWRTVREDLPGGRIRLRIKKR